jgi:hypothetical protein
MAQYGEPQSFTLDYGEMNILFEMLEEAFKTRKGDELKRLERLRWLRNDLYRRLD